MPLPGRFAIPFKPRQNVVRAFLFDEDATTAIEFGLLSIPFFALICAILETAMIFLASQLLDSAVQDASRFVRTGQAQETPGYNLGSFNTDVCNGLAGIFKCDQLRINVRTVTNFASATVTSPINPTTGSWTLDTGFSPGTGSSVVLVQVYYKWPVLLNFDSFNLATSTDGTHLMSAVRVFANEPFTS